MEGELLFKAWSWHPLHNVTIWSREHVLECARQLLTHFSPILSSLLSSDAAPAEIWASCFSPTTSFIPATPSP